MVYFIEAQYPDSQMYDSGVDTILFEAERKNPGAKVFNFRLRSTILDSLVRRSAYEALLVSRNGCITEGSRSNVYFISGSRVITAGDEFVLGGITRKYVNNICTERDINLEYRCMPVVELKTVEAVFLSGTSPHLLPVRSINEFKFRVEHPVLRTLIEAYQDIVKSYISLRREIE
jgi:branched-chain amino acid aminotransferase